MLAAPFCRSFDLTWHRQGEPYRECNDKIIHKNASFVYKKIMLSFLMAMLRRIKYNLSRNGINTSAVSKRIFFIQRKTEQSLLCSDVVPMFITTLSQTRMKSRFLAADKYISPKKSNSVGASWLKPSRKIAHLRLSSPPYIMEAQRRQAR